MTDQPPYQPPSAGYPSFDYYYQQQPDFLAPARRAATMLYVIGALALLSSFCCIGAGSMLPRLMQNPDFAGRMQAIPGITPEMMRLATFTIGGGALVFGVVLIVLGTFVARGGKGAASAALVLAIQAAMFLLLNLVQPIIMRGRAADVVVSPCILVFPLALMLTLIAWLITAINASDQAMAARYAQYWQQYAQQGRMPSDNQALPPPQQPPPPPPPSEPPS